MEITRRRLLAVMGTAALAGCATPAGTPQASASEPTSAPGTVGASASAASSPALAATGASGLPATHAWAARRGDVSPAVKRRATTLVETVGAWTQGRGDHASARARAAAAGYDPALADALAPLLGAGTDAVVSVRDAQYGGILSTTSSVLVVVDQWRRLADGTVHAGGTTVDVRLVAAKPHWRVVAAYPAAPGRAAKALSATARRVLADSRVHLPYAAHADVLAGRIHDSVLGLLLGLSTKHVVDVSVLRSGHPLHVFGTSRTSDHPRGRAVDVWALDSRPLVLPANHGLAIAGMRYAVAHGAYNVGGPVRLSGAQYFSDATHQDHIHLGFNR